MAKAKTTEPESKSGRPAGARNIPTAAVMELPPSCPKCGSVGPHEYVRTVKTLRQVGVIGDGAKFNLIVWRIRRCECGQQLSVRTYEWRTGPELADSDDS